MQGPLPPPPHRSAGTPVATPSRTTVVLRSSLLLLLLVTVGLMAWYELGMERELVLDVDAEIPVLAIDDREIGGASVARLERTDDGWILRCEIRKRVEWPFCQLDFELEYAPGGVDLSRYDTLHLDLDVTGPGDPRVRIHLLNFEPEYSTVTDSTSLRVNEIEYRPGRAGPEFTVPLEQFEVPAWWRTQYDTPFEDSRSRLDNVSRIQISTDSVAREGEHVIAFGGLRFTGKWIRRDALYLGIMSGWMLIAFGYLLAGMLATRRRAREAQQRQRELEDMNQVLQLQSDDFREKAHRDPLTGALNRVGLRELLRDRIEAVRAGRTVLSLVLMDVDHFKRINDTYGHPTGDAVLKAFAQRIEGNTRSDDHLVRWGGEEFLLVCTGVDRAEAARLAEKLRAMIAGSDWPHGEPLTCSLGVGRLGDETIAELLERVDQALYRAKTNGRDRVEVADEDVGTGSGPSTDGEGLELHVGAEPHREKRRDDHGAG